VHHGGGLCPSHVTPGEGERGKAMVECRVHSPILMLPTLPEPTQSNDGCTHLFRCPLSIRAMTLSLEGLLL
jgi:hypothetical protein